MYSTPELLLVGAAQNVVLGFSFSERSTAFCQPDIVEPPTDLYVDIEGW